MSAWINDIWRAGQVNKGGIVRRNIHTVAQNGGADLLEREVRARGFHMARIGEQYLIMCDPNGTMQIIC
jgi:phage baseplate assembly protein gpV